MADDVVEGPIARVARLMSEAADAVEAGSYSVAITKATAAQAVMAGVPRQAQANVSLEYTPDGIARFIDNVTRLNDRSAMSTGGGIRTHRVAFCDPS